jgi:hypothetical protein
MNPMLVSSRLDFSPACWAAAPSHPGAPGAASARVAVEASAATSVPPRFERATPGT